MHKQAVCRNGNGSDLYEIGSRYHLLPYFNLNLNTDTNIFEYKYKIDALNLAPILIFTSIQRKSVFLNSIYMNKRTTLLIISNVEVN